MGGVAQTGLAQGQDVLQSSQATMKQEPAEKGDRQKFGDQKTPQIISINMSKVNVMRKELFGVLGQFGKAIFGYLLNVAVISSDHGAG